MNVGGDLGLAMRLVLDGNAQSEMLIDAATSALVEGLNSPSLRALAGLLVRDAPYDGQRLAERALDELGLLLADSRAASRAVARLWSRAILDGTARPFVAGQAIWKSFTGSDQQLPDLAAEFLALEDEFEGGWGRTEPEIAAEVRRSALRLLDVWGDPLDAAHRFHSAVRDEIRRRFDHLAVLYSLGAPWEVAAAGATRSTAQPEEVFPRYRILEALLIEVERINPTRLLVTDLRLKIADCVEKAAVVSWLSYSAAEDELRSFETWLDVFDPSITPSRLVPYRRTLDDGETSALRSELGGRWTKGDGCWHPVTSEPVPNDVVIVDSSLWLDESIVNALRQALLDEGVTVLSCLNELRPSIEVATEFFDPAYGSDGEILAIPLAGWFVIYTSHEGTTAFSPGPHLDRLRTAVPDFDRWIWHGWR